MSYYFPNVDPIYLLKREGTDNDPFLFLIDEGNVANKSYIMREIPSHKSEVKVSSASGEMTEVDKEDVSSGEYRVDYSTGNIHFHSDMNGKKITVEYHGMGFVNIPTSRIQMPNGEGDPIETLQNALDRVDDAINVLGEVGDLDFKGEYNPSSNYKKWNFVTYDNKTFVSIKSSTGISPNSSEYWRLVSSGVGASGVFDSEKTYTIGDLVSDKDKRNVYVSKSIDNNSPLDDSDNWELIISLDDTVQELSEIIDSKISELNSLKDHLNSKEQERDDNEERRDNKLNDSLGDLSEIISSYDESEKNRNTGESDRVSAENKRDSNEELRKSNETQRELQESSRESQEQERNQEFRSLIADNQEKTDQIEEGLETIGDKSVEIDIIVSEAEVMLANGDIMLDNLDNFKHFNEYVSDEDYYQYNIVTFDGSTYIAAQDVEAEREIEITNEDYWKPLALKGKDGTEITVEGISPDEDNNIDLGGLGLATESQVVEVEEKVEGIVEESLGNLSDLRTAKKDNMVDAVNELKDRIDTIIDIIT